MLAVQAPNVRFVKRRYLLSGATILIYLIKKDNEDEKVHTH